MADKTGPPDASEDTAGWHYEFVDPDKTKSLSDYVGKYKLISQTGNTKHHKYQKIPISGEKLKTIYWADGKWKINDGSSISNEGLESKHDNNCLPPETGWQLIIVVPGITKERELPIRAELKKNENRTHQRIYYPSGYADEMSDENLIRRKLVIVGDGTYRHLVKELNKHLTEKNCLNAELRKLVMDLSIGDVKFEESNILHVSLFVLAYHLFKTRDNFEKYFEAVAKLLQNSQNGKQKFNIPEVAIHSMEHFLSFLNDSKVAGIVNVKEGKFQTVGNTTAGKTSLIKTITEGKSYLTEDDPALLATKVVEVYGNIQLNYSLRQKLKINKSDETCSTLVQLEELDDVVSTTDEPFKIIMNGYDCGGQQEYAMVNDSIITDSSIIAICFDANKYDYSTSIAAFLDVIFTAGQLMVIVLIATHCFEGNSLQFNEEEVIKSSTDHYLARCKDTKSDKNPILIQKVFKVSSKTCEGIENMKEGLHTIYANDDLLPLSSNYPLIWKELNIEMRRRMDDGIITLQQAEKIFQDLMKNISFHTKINISSNEIEMIDEMQRIGETFYFENADIKTEESHQVTDIQPQAASRLPKRRHVQSSGRGIRNMWTTFLNFFRQQLEVTQQLEVRQRTREVLETATSSAKKPLACLTALQFLEDTGSILMFTNTLGKRIIYPDVALLTRSLRFVVRHDLADSLKASRLDLKLVEDKMDFNLDWDVKRVLETGYLSWPLLLLLHDLHRKEEQKNEDVPILAMDHIIEFMEKMGIAEKTEENKTYSLFVPSLLAKTIQDLRNEVLDTYLIRKNKLQTIFGVQYDFQMGFGSINILNQILVKLHNKKGDYKANVLNAYSQRIEMREPGVVSFVHMSLHGNDLYIKEEEVSTDDENFYRTRCITAYFILEGEEDVKWNTINFVDETAQAVIEKKGQKAWTRWIICNQCLVDDNPKHFSLIEDTPKNIGRFRKNATESLNWDRTNRCSRKKHQEGVFKSASKMNAEPSIMDETVLDKMLPNVVDTGAKVNADFNQSPGNKLANFELPQACTIYIDKRQYIEHVENVVFNLHQELQMSINREIYSKFVENIDEKAHLEKLTALSKTGSGLAIPKLLTIQKSICLLAMPGPAFGTAFLAKVEGVAGIVLFSAGHNFHEGSHGIESQDYSNYKLMFNNLEGITTSVTNTHNPPTSSTNQPYTPTPSTNPPNPLTSSTLNASTLSSNQCARYQYTIKELMDKFQRCSIFIAYKNAKREDKIELGKTPSFTIDKSGKNKHEDYFALILHDDANETAEDKLTKLGLTILAEVGEGSSLDQNPRCALTIFGHPFVKEDYKRTNCIPLRFSFGNERHEKCLKSLFGSGWKGSDQKTRSHERIFYDYDTLPGNSGSPVLARQDIEPHYYVKGIHVAGEKFNGIVTNEAQRLTNILQKLKNVK